jgi:hypothetical protein
MTLGGKVQVDEGLMNSSAVSGGPQTRLAFGDDGLKGLKVASIGPTV